MQAAIGSQEGVTRIDTGPESQFRRTGGRGVEVPVISLDRLVREYGPIDQLKIDVEGAEYDTLLGSSNTVLEKISTISLEYHPTYVNEKEFRRGAELIEYLQRSGFDLQHSRDDGNGYGTASFIRRVPVVR